MAISLNFIVKWALPILVSLILFCNHYVRDCPGALQIPLEREIGFTPQDYSILNALYFFPNIISPLLAGILIDRLGGTVKCFYYSILVASAGHLTFALGASMANKGIMFFGKGLSGSMYEIIDAVMPISYIGPMYKADFQIVIGVVQIFIRLGSVVNFIVSPIAYAKYGLVPAIWIASLVGVSSILLLFTARTLETSFPAVFPKSSSNNSNNNNNQNKSSSTQKEKNSEKVGHMFDDVDDEEEDGIELVRMTSDEEEENQTFNIILNKREIPERQGKITKDHERDRKVRHRLQSSNDSSPSLSSDFVEIDDNGEEIEDKNRNKDEENEEKWRGKDIEEQGGRRKKGVQFSSSTNNQKNRNYKKKSADYIKVSDLSEHNHGSNEHSPGDNQHNRGRQSFSFSSCWSGFLELTQFHQFSAQYYLYLLSGSFLYGSIVPFWFYGSKYLQDTLFYDIGRADSIMSLPEGLVVVTSFPFNFLISRYLSGKTKKLAVLGVSLLAMSLSFVCLFFAAALNLSMNQRQQQEQSSSSSSSQTYPGPMYLSLFAVVLLGSAFSLACGLFWGIVNDIVEEKYLSQGSGILSCAVNFLPSVLPPILSLLTTTFHNPHSTIIVLSVMAFLGALSSFMAASSSLLSFCSGGGRNNRDYYDEYDELAREDSDDLHDLDSTRRGLSADYK
jgi:hypothetical protein